MASTTVAQFAAELKIAPSCCSSSCALPACSKTCDNDTLSEEDKARLLDLAAARPWRQRRRREEEDHADAQADLGDQAGRRHRQGAHDPGRGAQEARLREARRSRCPCRGGDHAPAPVAPAVPVIDAGAERAQARGRGAPRAAEVGRTPDGGSRASAPNARQREADGKRRSASSEAAATRREARDCRRPKRSRGCSRGRRGAC